MSKNAKNSVVTVQDIAREIGMSPSSVSAVLSGQHVKRRIAPETAQRVMEAARKLRYVPNVRARSLRAKDTGTKQVLLSIMTAYEAPVFLVAQALRALEAAIQLRGEEAANYTVSLEMFHAGSLRRLAGVSESHRCNGALITNTVDLDDQFLAATKLPFPVVLMGRRIAGYASVSARSDAIGRQAAEILLGAGRRHLAVLQPAVLTQATRSRLAAFVTTAEQVAGIPPIMITCDNLQESAGYDAMRRYLAFDPKVDGIFSLSDGLAIGAYCAIKRSGRVIPKDIAVVGVGDNPASHYLDPPLTCFESAEDSHHQSAAKLLLDLVNGSPPKNLTIEVPLVALLKESTGHTSSLD